MGQIVKLKNVRGAFMVLGEPEFFGGSKQKPTDKRRWSATALIPAADPQKKLVDEALIAVAKEQWPQKWQQKLANILPDPKGCCFTDGNRKPDYDGFPGHWALTAHRTEDKGRPIVFDNDKSPIYKTNNELYEGKAGRIFSGCFINMHVEIWAQENNQGAGLRATLQGIQRYGVGPAFGGGRAPNPDDFDELPPEEEESLS
jgi:Protein of unknown function (DUF2815)